MVNWNNEADFAICRCVGHCQFPDCIQNNLDGRVNLILDLQLELIAVFLCCEQFVNQAFGNSIRKGIVNGNSDFTTETINTMSSGIVTVV